MDSTLKSKVLAKTKQNQCQMEYIRRSKTNGFQILLHNAGMPSKHTGKKHTVKTGIQMASD